MPKKSKKSKSKRQTLRQKYKVIRKVKEHHRKKRKEAKKLGIKKKEPKDPGIPNSWPFKEELIEQLTAQRQRQLARQQALKDARRVQAMDTDAKAELGHLQAAASDRAQKFEQEKVPLANKELSFIDSSRKAFFKDFVHVVESADVIVQVLDARDPLGTRCVEVERFIRKTNPSKRILLLLNKIDLVPREVAEKWLKYLREEMPTLAFKCSTQKQSTHLGTRASSKKKTSSIPESTGSEAAGSDTLLQLIKTYARNAGLKTAITVGIVGLPNVGKSSLINSLKRAKVAQVGNTPGVTRGIQEIHLDKQVRLLDSPGVVFADASSQGEAAAALRNAVKVEKLEDPVAPVGEIVRRCPAKQLMKIYNVAKYSSAEEFLDMVATARGKLRRGGAVDITAAARIILQDWNDGRIPYYTLPPKRETEIVGSAQVVPIWGKDFEAVLAEKEVTLVASLPSLNEEAGFFQTHAMDQPVVDIEAMAEGSSDLEEDDDDDDAMNEEEAKLKPGLKSKNSSEKQNEKLYDEEGQYNPHIARAERKKRRKGAVQHALDSDGGDDSDYDFGDAKLWAGANHYDNLESEEEDMMD